MKILLPLVSLLFLSIIGQAQEKFNSNELHNPHKYGPKIEGQFKIVETDQYSLDTTGPYDYLQNGLRSSSYLNPDAWLMVKDEVELISIDVVFSKYPIRKNGYSMNHKLLFNRLKKLFEIDPDLNDSSLDWQIVLHTNCFND